ncbi:MAG: response regulator [Bacteroidales bacterium]|nr:response regulator [Bacteroidales bacterium]
MKILIVEDNLINQKIIELCLKKLDYSTVTAVDGKDAIDKFCSNNFDIIMMDVQLPIMDGIEATRKIRQIEKDNNKVKSVIIAMTANCMRDVIDQCLEAGMDTYIKKPVKPVELEKQLREILKKKL